MRFVLHLPLQFQRIFGGFYGLFSTIFVMLAVFLGSLMRATFGFGDSVISMPLLALLPIPAVLAAIALGNRIYAHIETDKFKQYVFYLIFVLGIFNLMEIF